MERSARSVLAFRFLCLFPFLTFVCVAARPLRIPGVHQALGLLLFAVIVASVWFLVGPVVISGPEPARGRALAGILLLAPWAAIALLWVGLGPPQQATRDENWMRFLVLLSASIVISAGFVALTFALHEAGERLWSTGGAGASISAGTGYFVGMAIVVASYLVRRREGRLPEGFAALDEVFSVVEFFGCVLTYLATAMFAASMARARWLSRDAARGYAVACLVLLVLLFLRGIDYPTGPSEAPWYARAGVIAGIPAIPWFLPALLGAVVLRRAGEARD